MIFHGADLPALRRAFVIRHTPRADDDYFRRAVTMFLHAFDSAFMKMLKRIFSARLLSFFFADICLPAPITLRCLIAAALFSALRAAAFAPLPPLFPLFFAAPAADAGSHLPPFFRRRRRRLPLLHFHATPSLFIISPPFASRHFHRC